MRYLSAVVPFLFGCGGDPGLAPPSFDPPPGSRIEAVTSPPPVAGAAVLVACPDANASVCIEQTCLPARTRTVRLTLASHRIIAWCLDVDRASAVVVADFDVYER